MSEKLKSESKPVISLSDLPALVVVVFLIVGIGALFGLLGYLFFGLENLNSVVNKPTGEITENNSDDIDMSDWKTYRNEEHGFEFKYPNNWEIITFKHQENNDVYAFDSTNEMIKAVWYHKPSGAVVFIMKGDEYELSYGGENYQETLKVIFPNKKMKVVYTVSPEMTSWGGRIDNINISPNGKYIAFILSGYEYHRPLMINIETSQNIFKEVSVWFNNTNENILWSLDNKVLAIKSEVNDFSGDGILGLFVSDYGNPEKLNKVFSIESERRFQGIHMGDMWFTDNEELFFEVIGETKKYIYNTKTKKLNEFETESSDWKTYRNEKYKYSFKIPPNSQVYSGQYGTGEDVAFNISVAMSNDTNPYIKNKWIKLFEIEVQDPEMFSNRYSYMNFDVEDFANKMWEFNKKVGDLSQIIIDGKKAYKFTLSGSFSSDRGGYVLNDEHLYVITNDDSYNYIICLPTENNYSKEILNSFIFE